MSNFKNIDLETPAISRLTNQLWPACKEKAEGAPMRPLLPLQSRAAALFGSVEGLLLDMGDVLYDATAWRRWLLQLLSRMGLHAHYRSFFRIWDRDYLDAVHRGRRRYDEAFQAFLLSAGLSCGQIDEVVAASHARKRSLEDDARPLPGVRSTLIRLRNAGVKLGVLSDSECPASALSRRLVQLGLGELFTVVVSSVDLGHTKPEAICYTTALAQMKMKPAQVAFVGHDAEELIGAHRVGMRTLAFNFDPDVAADLFLGRFDELLQLVSCDGTGERPTRGAA